MPAAEPRGTCRSYHAPHALCSARAFRHRVLAPTGFEACTVRPSASSTRISPPAARVRAPVPPPRPPSPARVTPLSARPRRLGRPHRARRNVPRSRERPFLSAVSVQRCHLAHLAHGARSAHLVRRTHLHPSDRIASRPIASHRIASHPLPCHLRCGLPQVRRLHKKNKKTYRINLGGDDVRARAFNAHANKLVHAHATLRHTTPHHATPRHATPRHATPRHATPRTTPLLAD
jgi:hypothetical protein